MIKPPIPAEEPSRLAALLALNVLDSEAEQEFDALVQAAAHATGWPIALISLVDADRQWFKANYGLPGVCETPRDVAFCAHTILQDEMLEVHDAREDPRFCGNPLVTGAPGIRAYVGVPLRLDGGRVGTLCVIDFTPGALDDDQRAILSHLARAAVSALEGRRAKQALASSEQRLREEHARLSNAVDGTQAATWEWNVQTGEVRFNKRWAQFVGYSLEELSPVSIHTWRSLTHPDDLQKSRERLKQSLSGHDGQYECELRMRHKAGHWVWVLGRGQVMSWTADGEPEWMYGIHLEISDIKRREQALRDSEERLNRVGEVAGIGGWEYDCATGDISWSDQTFRIHGLEPGELPSVEEAIEFYAPEAREVISDALQRCINEGVGYDLELPFIQACGQRIWVRAKGNAVIEGGRVSRVTGAFQDITESYSLRAKLAREHELLRVTLESIGDAVITTNAQGRIEWLNPVAERMTGWSAEEAHGQPLPKVFRIVHEESRRTAANPVEICLRRGHVVGLPEKTVLIARDGAEHGIEDSASPIRAADGRLLGAVLVFHDVTEQRRLAREMTHRATHDALTGLYNRSEFEARLERLVPMHSAANREHALLFIDLDQFKLVNDSCGHAQGDRLLQQVSQLLGERLRTNDLLARLGGDEFAVILENCDAVRALDIAEQICEAMEEFRFTHAERSFRVGASIGLVPIDSRWESAARVMQAADSACYTAKEAGRNRVHFWAESDTALQERHGDMRWATRLERALETEQLVLYAQKIVPLGPQSNQGEYLEVLLRMHDGKGGVISPGAFMPAAERFHMSTRIDRYVLRKALAWLAESPDAHDIGTLAINLSGRSVGDLAFHDFAFRLFNAVGSRACRRVCLEITETEAVGNLSQAADFVERVRKLGVRVALDDFGSGAASFGYLKAIPVDILKIDGQFVRNVVNDPLDAAAVRSFADVAQVMGLTTVAEFVEDHSVADALRAYGIDFMQGFLNHRPEPLERLAYEPRRVVERSAALM